MAEMVYQRLLDILGPVNMKDYCGSHGKYLTWEREVVEPKLKELGYTITCSWWTTDHDWFGPLSRAVKVSRDGQEVVLTYG